MVCHGSSSYGWSIRGSPVWRRKYPFSNGDLRDSASVLYNYLEAIRELKTHVPTRPNTSQPFDHFEEPGYPTGSKDVCCFTSPLKPLNHLPSGIHCGENPMGRFALHFRWDHVWRHRWHRWHSQSCHLISVDCMDVWPNCDLVTYCSCRSESDCLRNVVVVFPGNWCHCVDDLDLEINFDFWC